MLKSAENGWRDTDRVCFEPRQAVGAGARLLPSQPKPRVAKYEIRSDLFGVCPLYLRMKRSCKKGTLDRLLKPIIAVPGEGRKSPDFRMGENLDV